MQASLPMATLAIDSNKWSTIQKRTSRVLQEFKTPDTRFQHISFFLPDGWKTMPKTKGEGRLMGAAHGNDGQPGGMVFALITAPDSSHKGVKDPYFLKDYQRAWSRKGFTKFGKSQLVTVGGREAMRCEAHKPGTNQSMLNYTFIDQGHMIGLLFAYYGMPITKGPAVQRIVDSFSIGR